MNKKKITYLKNDEVKDKKIGLFNKRKLLKSVLKDPYDGDFFDVYKISDNVKYIEIENMVFNREIKFFTPDDTILVLKNCTFKKNKIDLIGGTIILEEPILDPSYYTNRFYAGDVKKLSFKISNDKLSYLTIVGKAESLDADVTNRINRIGINTKKISLKNISELKSMDLNSEEINIENCNFYLENDLGIKIAAKDMKIKESNLSLQGELTINNINANRLKIEDSLIEIASKCSPEIILMGQELSLINSCLSSKKNICIKYPTIKIDEQSKIQTNGQVILVHDIYKNELTLEELEQIKPYKELISILKGHSRKLSKK